MWAKNKHQPGFTIVELLIVVVVIAILAAITIVAFSGIQDRAKFTNAQSSLRNLNNALQSYHAKNGSYPVTGTTSSPSWRYSCNTGITNFMPGVTEVVQNLPPAPCKDVGMANNDTWLYGSDGQGFKLVYIRPIMSDGSLSNVPATMRDPARWGGSSSWGYWTSDWANV